MFNQRAKNDTAVKNNSSGALPNEQPLVVPVIDEAVALKTRTIEKSRVRVSKTAHKHKEVIECPVREEEVVITRVTKNECVKATEPTRRVGDLIVVPVYEERLEIHKQLILKEEIHIRRRVTSKRRRETVVLQREEAHVERLPVTDDSSGQGT